MRYAISMLAAGLMASAAPVMAQEATGVGDKLHAALVDEADDLRGVIAENSGHFVAEEEPEFFCAELKRFLQS